MQNELDIVRDVSQRMEEAGIEYMLTGSMAMNFYAQPRMTRDIDLVVALGAADSEAIVQAFSGDYYISLEAVRDSIAHESLFNLIHEESVIKVDCIVRKASAYRQLEFERRHRVVIGDFSTWIVSKEDLIISKLDWAKDSQSDQQLRDVRNLAGSDFDTDYVDKWTEALGLAKVWQDIRP